MFHTKLWMGKEYRCCTRHEYIVGLAGFFHSYQFLWLAQCPNKELFPRRVNRLEDQGHGEGSYDQNMIVHTIIPYF